ncbi:SEC-C domain-containing protein [Kineosporia sp. J2-2]|uniref:SEC-C domain-containing protein n=1 Tax=Kineosporia corallincola TaxID=2835133 RepID=A0ABS5TJ70_9ACTN|nr:DUF5926 family protein [Kineosporia corallincola]MBT0771151.1 SEC-C domain-containing protein [Kineosporia corallincola]
MGKKQRRTGSAPAAVADGEIPVVGGREACPCGSGKRYKACHGRAARIEAMKLVVRPFEGLAGECDWVAMREIVPAATAVVPVKEEFGGGTVTVSTILPMAWPALHRADGEVLLGLQTGGGSGDASRDLADALLKARELEAGSPVVEGELPGPGPRLQDVLDLSGGFDVTVHDGFEFWFAADNELTPEVRESLEQANGQAVPTRRLKSVEAAYWVQMGARRHLRWVLPDDESAVLDGIARLHAAGESALLPETKYVGSFRACGLIVPVWDLADDTEPEELEKPIVAFGERLREAMAVTAPLTAEERRVRAGVVSRQVTLR